MFDWNDEELTNIIWGEDWEGNNRNDPYPDHVEDICKKGTNEQVLGVSTVERKKSTSKSENGVELDRISMYDFGERALPFCPGSWPATADLSPRNAAKVEQDSLCTDASNNLKGGSKNSFLGDNASEFDKNSEMFEKPAEDAEERDFVFCGWANIGSFEDLDRMFSDNDTIFGDLADANGDELWSSSKDFTNIPHKFTPLCGDSSEQSEINDHSVLYPSQSSSSVYETANKIKYKAPQNVQTFVTEGKIQGSLKLPNDRSVAKHDTLDKGNRQRRSKNQFVPSVVNPSSALQNSQAFQPKHFSGVHSSVPPYDGNIMNYYAGPPVMLSSGYEAPPINANSSKKTSEDAPAKPPPMTPKEKIKKLRRRQQMRAILAIQKQQMQFKNRASISEKSSLEGGKVAVVQGASILPILNTSVTEKDDRSTISMAMDNCSVEETVLYRLQDAVSKLDMRVRLSIRDSLFRLAQSALQRQHPNDTSSTCASSKDESCNYKDMIRNQRFNRVPDMETETNPIDRTVARLLFHVDLSGKPAETSESPSSKSIANGYFPEVSESSQMTSSHSMLSNEHRSRTASFFVSPMNPTNDEHQGRLEMES